VFKKENYWQKCKSCPKQLVFTVRVGSYYTSCNGNPKPNHNANTNLSASCDGTRRRLLLAAFLFTE